ncbi:MAG: molybdopterin-dependent oxidoreductase [Lentimicrobium sp.]|nr:molybdopterin-dependent oxidoreductase [Lentimicrobium sp.]
MEENGLLNSTTATNQHFKTICHYCAIGCTLEVKLNEGNVVETSGTSGLINPDAYSCSLGRQGYSYLNDSQRLTQPLIRTNGGFEQISWDDAFNLLEQKLKEGQPEEKAFFAGARLMNEEQYLIQKLARGAVKTNNITSFHYLGRGSDYTKLSKANLPFAELEESRQVYLIGADLVNNPMVETYIRDKQSGNNLKVISLSPDAKKTKKQWVDHTVEVKSYYYFVKAVNHYLLNNELQNRQFIKDLIANLDEYRTQLLEESWLDLVKLSGVESADTIIEFAIDYNLAQRAVIVFSEKELSGHTCAEIFNLACITGKHGKTGSGLMLLKEKNNSHGLHDMGVFPNLGIGATDWNDPIQRSTIGFNWRVYDELPSGKGCTLNGMRNGLYKQLYIFGEDPLGCAINPEETLQMFADKDFIVVQDCFLTETAKIANLVLPASLPFESGGTYTNTQRVIQKIDSRMVPKVGFTSWQQLDTLCVRFGFEPHETVDDVTLELASVLPKFCTSSKLMFRATTDDNFNPMFTHGCDYLHKRATLESEK